MAICLVCGDENGKGCICGTCAGKTDLEVWLLAKVMVTGHRPERLNGRELEVTEWLDSQIRELQPTIAISGMAAGADPERHRRRFGLPYCR